MAHSTETTVREGRSAWTFYIAALVLIVIGVAMTLTMGLPGLGLFGLGGTALIMVLLMAFAIGA